MFGQVPVGQDILVWACTHDPQTGASVNADGNVTFQWRVDTSYGGVVQGTNLTTGLYWATIPGAEGSAGQQITVYVEAQVGGIWGKAVVAAYLRESNGGGLSQQDVRDAMTLATAEIPVAGSIDEKIDKTPGNTWTIPGRTIEGGTVDTCISNTDMRGTDNASTHTPTDVATAGQYADGAVWLSPDGAPGTVFGVNGTQTNPCSTLADAVTIAKANAIHKIAVSGINMVTTDENLDRIRLVPGGQPGVLNVTGGGSLDLSLAEVDRVELFGGPWTTTTSTIFRNCTLNPIALGNQGITARDCNMSGSTNWAPSMNTGLFNCYVQGANVQITLPPVFFCTGFRGQMTLMGGNAATTYRLDDFNGELIIDNGFQAAELIVNGIGKLTDNWGGNLDREGFIEHAQAAEPNYGEYADGAVWINADGMAGTTPFVNGTQANPVPDFDDAYAIATALNLARMVVIGGTVEGTDDVRLYQIGAQVDLNHFDLIGIGRAQVAIVPGGELDLRNSTIRNIDIGTAGGTLVANGNTRWFDCPIQAAHPGGKYIGCEFLAGVIAPTVDGSRLVNCTSPPGGLVVTVPQNFGVFDHSGALTLYSCPAGYTVPVGVDGDLTLGSDNAATAVFDVTGAGVLTNNALSTVNRDGYFDGSVDINGTKKRLDDLNDVSPTDVLEQSDQALRGQRLHELMNEPDVALPGAGSLLGKMITTPSYNADGRQFTDSALELATATTTGQAQGGTADTITLANDEPGGAGDDNVFQGSTIAIQAGTGFKQVRTCTAYDASTRVATVSPAWNTTPDATSHYTVYPGPTAGAQGGGNDVNVVSIAGQAITNQAGQNVNYHYDNAGQPTTKTVEDTGVPGTGLTPQMVRDSMQLSPTTPGANAPDSIDERVSQDERRRDVWHANDTEWGSEPNSMGLWQTIQPSVDPSPFAIEVWKVPPDHAELTDPNSMAELQRKSPSDLVAINGEATNDHLATLKLKQLHIKHDDPVEGRALMLEGSGVAGAGLVAVGDRAGINAFGIGSNSAGILAEGGSGGSGFKAQGEGGGDGFECIGGAAGGHGWNARGNGSGHGAAYEGGPTGKDIDADEIDAIKNDTDGIKAQTDLLQFHNNELVRARMDLAHADAVKQWVTDDTGEDTASTRSVAELSKATEVTVPSAEEIADQVWRENLADHSSEDGSTAQALAQAAEPCPDPTPVGDIVDGVWNADNRDYTEEHSTGNNLFNAGGVGAVNVTIAPLDVTIADPIHVDKDFTIPRNAAEPAVVFTFFNADGTPLDLSTFDAIKFNAFKHGGRDNTPVWFRDLANGIRVTGENNNQLEITWNPSDIDDTKVWAYTLYIVDTDMVLARGSVTVVDTSIDRVTP